MIIQGAVPAHTGVFSSQFLPPVLFSCLPTSCSLGHQFHPALFSLFIAACPKLKLELGTSKTFSKFKKMNTLFSKKMVIIYTPYQQEGGLLSYPVEAIFLEYNPKEEVPSAAHCMCAQGKDGPIFFLPEQSSVLRTAREVASRILEACTFPPSLNTA